MARKPARTRRAFGAVEQLRSGRYRARYRDPATTAWISAPNTFPSKIDAEGWLADERRLIDLGTWISPEERERLKELEKQADSHTVRVHMDRWLSEKERGRLAEEIDGAVIAIVHQTKSSGSDFVSGINGSSAYGEVARAVFATAVDAESGKRVISQGKNSLGPLMVSHEYVLEIESLKTIDGKPKTSPRFSLGGETNLSAGEIFNRNKKIDSGET